MREVAELWLHNAKNNMELINRVVPYYQREPELIAGALYQIVEGTHHIFSRGKTFFHAIPCLKEVIIAWKHFCLRFV